MKPSTCRILALRVAPSRSTTVTFWPDETIFETVEFSARTITERLQKLYFDQVEGRRDTHPEWLTYVE